VASWRVTSVADRSPMLSFAGVVSTLERRSKSDASFTDAARAFSKEIEALRHPLHGPVQRGIAHRPHTVHPSEASAILNRASRVCYPRQSQPLEASRSSACQPNAPGVTKIEKSRADHTLCGPTVFLRQRLCWSPEQSSMPT
jgi:hypothetical protein